MAKVLIMTFKAGQNQGCTVHLGIKTLKVTQEDEQVSLKDGCISRELIVKAKVPTVTINGRRFILEAVSPWFKDKGADLMLTLPPDLASALMFCPHCGEII